MQPTDVIQWVTNVTYVVCAVAAYRLWRNHREAEAARWLMVTFAILAAIILATFWIPEDVELPRFVVALLLAAILVFPWALLRFADIMTGPRPRQVQLVTAVTAIVVAWGFLIPDFPGPDEPTPPAFSAYLFGLIGAWALGTGLTAWRLFRAGKGQAGVIRRRVRLLGTGALLLTLTLLVSSLNTGREASAPDNAVAIIAGLLSMGAAIAFLVGFAPPGLLRTWWRQEEEQELHRSSTRLMQAESAAEVASIVLPPFRRLLGADAIELTTTDGRRLGSLGSWDAFTDAPAWRVLERSSSDGLALRAVMSSTAPLFGQDEQDIAKRLLLIAGLAADRADRARELAVSNRELAAANEELEAFVYSASHDLKNPLIALLGYIDLLRSDAPFDEGSDHALFLDRIAANGRFMSSLIQDLLELSRVGRIEENVEPVDLATVVAAATERVSVEHPSLRVRVATPLPRLLMSVTRAEQLVTNVLVNAARYAGRDAEVVIEAEGSDDGEVRLVFQDDGPGIDPGQASRIFRVFERLDPEASDGNGIGLSICRKIAHSMGGDMFLEPSAAGARFVVTAAADHVLEVVRGEEPRRTIPAPNGRVAPATSMTLTGSRQ